MKVLRWVLLALVVASVSAYLAFPSLVASLAGRQAAAYGWTLNGLQVRRPGLAQLRVDLLELAGPGVSARIVGLEVSYTWRSLLNARATEIRVTELVAESLAGAGDDGAGLAQVGALVVEAPRQIDALWQALPADRLRIDRFRLGSTGDEVDVDRVDGELVGQLALLPGQITVVATAADLQLSAQIERAGEVVVEVSDTGGFARLEAQRDVTGTAVVDWRFDDLVHVSGSAPFAVDPQGWRVGKGIAVALSAGGDYAVNAQIDVAGVRGGWEETTEGAPHASVGWQGSLLQGDTRVDGVGQAQLTLHGGWLALELLPGSALASEVLRTEDVVASGVELVLPKPIALRANVTDATLSVDQAEFTLAAKSLRWLDHDFSPKVAVTIQDLQADADGVAAAFMAQCADLQLSATGTAKVKLAPVAWEVDVNLRQALASGLLDRALADNKFDYDIDAGNITTNLNVQGQGAAAYTGQGTLSLVGLAAHYDEFTATGIDGVFDIHFDQLTWRVASTRLAVGNASVNWPVTDLVAQLSVAGSARVKLEPDAWQMDANLQQTLASEFLLPAQRDDKLEYNVDSGTLHGNLTIRGKGASNYAGQGVVTLSGLAAHYDEFTASGIDGAFDVRFDEQTWRAESTRFVVGEVDAGFPITGLSARLSVTEQALDVTDATGITLGGTLDVDTLRYDVAEAASQFLLNATAIQLDQVLALEGDTLTGQGLLDGQLPVRVLDNEVSVTAGKFQARKPGGILRFGGASDAARSLDQTGVGFAIGALADFQFNVLDVGVDYDTDGDLLLGIRLEGFNPNFENGRPIHYNLNITENIPVLLESLQLSDEVGRRLESRLRD